MGIFLLRVPLLSRSKAQRPLYRPEDVVVLAFGHGYRRELSVPRKREVVASLLCRCLDGKALPLMIDGEDATAVEVFLGSGGGTFTLFVNGQVSLSGKERADLFVERWPATGGERALSLRSRQEWHPQRGKSPLVVRRGVNRSAESWHLRSVHRFGLQLCERVALGETANEPSDTFRSQLTELVAPPTQVISGDTS